jgi:hypothetical protein
MLQLSRQRLQQSLRTLRIHMLIRVMGAPQGPALATVRRGRGWQQRTWEVRSRGLKSRSRLGLLTGAQRGMMRCRRVQRRVLTWRALWNRTVSQLICSSRVS